MAGSRLVTLLHGALAQDRREGMHLRAQTRLTKCRKHNLALEYRTEGPAQSRGAAPLLLRPAAAVQPPPEDHALAELQRRVTGPARAIAEQCRTLSDAARSTDASAVRAVAFHLLSVANRLAAACTLESRARVYRGDAQDAVPSRRSRAGEGAGVGSLCSQVDVGAGLHKQLDYGLRRRPPMRRAVARGQPRPAGALRCAAWWARW
jgi:hypothetical protein